jgi:hypothetical protein
MKHHFTHRLLLLLACFSLFGALKLKAQTYFQEPFETMVDVGPPADSLVAPPGWDAERVSTVANPIITPAARYAPYFAHISTRLVLPAMAHAILS